MTTSLAYTSETTWRGDWPVADSKAKIGVKAFAPLGHEFPGGVKAGDVAWLLNDLCVHLNALEPIVLPGCWGWSFRPNKNNAKIPSKHGAGIAIDYNAPRHPNGKRGTWSKAIIAAIDHLLAERYQGAIRWGEHFHKTCDGMHFELNTSPEKLRVLVTRLKGVKPARTLPPGKAPGWFVKGCPVGGRSQELASALKVLADPRFPMQVTMTPKVAGLLRNVQRVYGLPQTGALTADTARAIADWHR